jgi:hypothetical protein
MHSIGHSGEVRIERTYNDTCVVRLDRVKSDKVLAIEGQQCSTFDFGKSQYCPVRHGLASLPRLLHAQNIVTETPKLLERPAKENSHWHIIEPFSSSLMLVYLTINLVPVCTVIGPGVSQVFSP